MKNQVFKSFAQLPSYLLLLAPVVLVAQSKPTRSSAAPRSPESKQPTVTQTKPGEKAPLMNGKSNREKAEKAFRAWQNGTSPITDLPADNLKWTIVGRSQASRTYNSKKQFIDEVLQPFGARFAQRFRPVNIRGLYADGDTVIVVWDGEGTRHDGKSYKNTYAWFMKFREGLVVEATAFYDSIAFNELWSEVAPKE